MPPLTAKLHRQCSRQAEGHSYGHLFSGDNLHTFERFGAPWLDPQYGETCAPSRLCFHELHPTLPDKSQNFQQLIPGMKSLALHGVLSRGRHLRPKCCYEAFICSGGNAVITCYYMNYMHIICCDAAPLWNVEKLTVKLGGFAEIS